MRFANPVFDRQLLFLFGIGTGANQAVRTKPQTFGHLDIVLIQPAELFASGHVCRWGFLPVSGDEPGAESDGFTRILPRSHSEVILFQWFNSTFALRPFSFAWRFVGLRE